MINNSRTDKHKPNKCTTDNYCGPIVLILDGKYYRVSNRKTLMIGDIFFNFRDCKYYRIENMKDIEDMSSVSSVLYAIIEEV